MANDDSAAYGEGFAAVYASPRYTVFSQRLARLALDVINELGAPDTELLDLACGAGAGSVVLAKAGYRVSGIDRSETIIARARELAAKQNVPLDLSVQDMRSFAAQRQYDVVTCLFDALNYITEENDLSAVFGSVARALRGGGLFVFDMNTQTGLKERWGTRDRVFTNRADVFEVNQSSFDDAASTNTTVTTIFVREPGTDLFRRYSEVHRERAYTVPTITGLLEQAGFDVSKVYGLPDSVGGAPQKFTSAYETCGRVVIAARKRAP